MVIYDLHKFGKILTALSWKFKLCLSLEKSDHSSLKIFTILKIEKNKELHLYKINNFSLGMSFFLMTSYQHNKPPW